jgi:hypothetical protein
LFWHFHTKDYIDLLLIHYPSGNCSEALFAAALSPTQQQENVCLLASNDSNDHYKDGFDMF